jgi:eukaryotic-like serine/threonine-protein kinase
MIDRPTIAHHPEVPAELSHRRGRVEIVGGAGSVSADHLYPVLLRRLRVVITVVAGFQVLAVGAGLLLFRDYNEFEWETEAEAQYDRIAWLLFWLQIAAVTGLAVLLWARPPASVRGLRGVELVTLGLFAAHALFIEAAPVRWNILEHLADTPQPQRQLVEGYFAHLTAFQWFANIVIYGIVVPNTARRCLAVVSIMAVAPLALIAAFGFWLWPVAPAVVMRLLSTVGLHNALAVAVVVFTASRVEVLRRQATEARRMGQYLLKERLGAGGMGEVYRAEHVLLRRPCAIKLIRPERAGDPKNLRRFEREVQVTATLTHPNTIQIYDYGRADDGTFYYVMEYLLGSNVEQAVKQHGPQPPALVVHILRQLCGALREAHAASLIHRDIKPSNVIVGERGGLRDVAKLLDFGIVDAPDADHGGAITAAGQPLGTPAYMSAEQAAGSTDLDARSDLYSLGATAYFMLTGQPPFDRPTINLTIAAQLRDPVTPPHFLRTAVPADLSAIVVRCLDKDPARRFQDAAELDGALATCKCADGWTDERPAQAAQSPPAGGEVQLSTRELERRWGV